MGRITCDPLGGGGRMRGKVRLGLALRRSFSGRQLKRYFGPAGATPNRPRLTPLHRNDSANPPTFTEGPSRRSMPRRSLGSATLFEAGDASRDRRRGSLIDDRKRPPHTGPSPGHPRCTGWRGPRKALSGIGVGAAPVGAWREQFPAADVPATRRGPAPAGAGVGPADRRGHACSGSPTTPERLAGNRRGPAAAARVSSDSP